MLLISLYIFHPVWGMGDPTPHPFQCNPALEAPFIYDILIFFFVDGLYGCRSKFSTETSRQPNSFTGSAAIISCHP